MKSTLLSCLLAVCLLLSQSMAIARPVSTSPLSHGSQSQGQAGSFNLQSAKQLFTAGSLNGLSLAIIQIGHQSLIVTNSTLLTAGEQIALDQVLAGGQQALVLNSNGMAVGGSFQLGSVSQPIASLVIPKGVTAIDNLTSSTSFNFTGNLINAGDLLVVSSNPQVASRQITALNIFNLGGGLISSAGATGGLVAHRRRI